jgi:hypothetical protein
MIPPAIDAEDSFLGESLCGALAGRIKRPGKASFIIFPQNKKRGESSRFPLSV